MEESIRDAAVKGILRSSLQLNFISACVARNHASISIIYIIYMTMSMDGRKKLGYDFLCMTAEAGSQALLV